MVSSVVCTTNQCTSGTKTDRKALATRADVGEVGEYLIFPGTEEWSRVLITSGEAPSVAIGSSYQ